jgi:hypothetical protein
MKRLRNVTVTLEEDVARWARLRAAHEETSVSRLVGEMLKQKMLEDAEYVRAMKQFLSLKPAVMSRGGRYPRREELHDRPRLR